MNNIFWVDLFCGAGGVTTGIHKAGQKVIACINHDKNAILSHQANHPETLHFTEDIRTIELSPILQAVKQVRNENKDAKICLWASLECTHFSNAKGGGSRDADSRTLAEHLYRYLDAIDFDYIYIENVEEFMSWGPLTAKTISIKTEWGRAEVCPIKFDKKSGKMQPIWKPESKTKGSDYIRWIKNICDYGYNHSSKILNCADYGDPTKRFRYFGIFAKRGLKISFPEPTHIDPKKVLKANLFTSTLEKWVPVKKCLDLKNTGNSIFDRKKPLVEKSLRRIYAGLIKYVMGNDKSVEEMIDTVCEQIKGKEVFIPIQKNGSDAVKPFLTKYNSNSPTTGISVPQDIDNPSSTICTHGRLGIVQAFLAAYYSSPNLNAEKSKVTSLENPSPSVTTIPHQSIVFLASYYGSDDLANDKHRISSINTPSYTLTCTPQQRLVFIAKYYSCNNAENQSGNIADIESPSSSLTTENKQSIVFLAKYYGQENQSVNACSVENPSPTLTTVDRFSLISCSTFLINPQYNNTVSSIEKPCFTIIARMDKTPPYIANIQAIGEINDLLPCIRVMEGDSEYMVKIKICMAMYGLADVKMRMLTIPELKQIQSFPNDYTLIGTQAEQKKYIGNAVPCNTVMNLVKCLS